MLKKNHPWRSSKSWTLALFICTFSLIWTLGFGHLDLAHAADYTPDQINLNFSYDDEFSLRDFTTEFNVSQPKALQAEQYFLIGPEAQSQDKGQFEVFIGEQALFDLLSQYQLRIINTDRITNIDLLGTTAIELIGDSFSSFEALRLVMFSYEGQSVAILYRGTSATEFQQFLMAISEPGPFINEGPRHVFQKEIDDVVERGIFNGYTRADGGKEFRGDQGINRAEFLKVIVLAAPGITEEIVQDFYQKYKAQIAEDDRIAQEDENPDTQILFPDVDREAWFAAYIFFALDKGWVGGYPDGSFRPTNPINMAEAPKIILAARNTFLAPDLDIWFKPYLDFLNTKNILIQRADQYRFSFSEQMFFPFEDVTRAQTAALLSRLLWVDERSDIDRFAQVDEAGSLPFTVEAQNLNYYRLDRSLSADAAEVSYLLYRGDQRIAEVLRFSPEAWTNRVRNDERIGELAPYRYLAENSSAIFASLNQCSSEGKCLSDTERDTLLDSFSVRQEDLLEHEDINTGLRFKHSLSLESQAQIEGEVKALQINRDDEEFFIFNFLNNSSEDVKFFEGDQADAVRRFGNRDWYIYQKQVGEESQLRLVASLGVRKILVAVVRNISNVSELDGKIVRILRTVERF